MLRNCFLDVFAGTEDKRRRSRQLRRLSWTAASHGWMLSRRELPGTVPVFYQDPAFDWALNQAQSTSQAIPQDGSGNAGSISGGTQGAGGAGGTSTITNNVIYDQIDDGPTEVVSETESGIVTSTAALPVIQPGNPSSIQGIELHVIHQNTDAIQTDANGPYNISDQNGQESTYASSSAPFNMIVQNTDGTTATGTMTINFTISISAYDTSGPDGTPRFDRGGSIGIASTYVDIVASSDNNGITVYQHGTSTVLASDPNFANTPIAPATPDLSFTYTATFPITTSVFVNYSSELDSNPDGDFGESQDIPQSEYATKTSQMTWDFSMVASA